MNVAGIPALTGSCRPINSGPDLIEEERMHEKEASLPMRYRLPILRLSGRSQLQICFVLRVRQATDWHFFAFQNKEQARVRRDLLKIDRLHEACVYLLEHDLRSEEEVRQHLDEVQKKIIKERGRLRAEKAADAVWSEKEKRIRDSYRDLEARLQDPDLPDDRAEKSGTLSGKAVFKMYMQELLN